MAGRSRKIVDVPGRPIPVITVIRDGAGSHVLAVYPPSSTEVILVFVSANDEPSARLAERGRGNDFVKEVRKAHLAVADDLKIEEMEKQFNDHEE